MNKKGILLAFATALISGISIYINKFGVAVADPVAFAFLKNSIVALMLISIVLTWKNWKLIKKFNLKKWLLLFAIGIIGGGIPFILFFKGLSITSAAQGSFIHKTMFIYVIILAVFFLREKINKYFILGAVLLLAGNLIVMKNLSFSPNTGDLFILIATIFWAVENVISKYAIKTIKSDIVASARMFFGAIFILGYLLISGQASVLNNLGLNQLGWVLVSSIFLFGYVIAWYRSLAKIPVSLAASILLLGLPITTALTAISSHEITASSFFSSLLVISGIAVIVIFGYEKIQNKKEELIGT